MKNINRLLIQLNKAVECINSIYPQEKAIAVTLLDNLIEVQLYKTLTTRMSLTKPKINPEDLRNYNDILKVSVNDSVISSSDRELLSLAHSIRNVIYHKGYLYDEDKIELALVLYYIFLSENFKNMHSINGMISYTDLPAYKEIDFGQTLINKRGFPDHKEYFEKCSNFIFSNWKLKETLPEIIKKILLKQIESIINSLEFFILSINDYDYFRSMIKFYDFNKDKQGQSKDIDFILLYYSFIRENKEALNYILKATQNSEECKHLFEKYLLKNNYTYPNWINLDKVKARIDNLNNKSEEIVIQNFRDIESKMNYLYQDISEASCDLDGYQQFLYDQYKGK